MSLFNRGGGKPVLIADIESGSVGIGVISLEGEESAQVLLSERAYLPLGVRDAEHSSSSISTLLSDVTGRVLKKYTESDAGKKHGPVASCRAFVSAPWVRSRTAYAETAFPKEQKVTDAVIKDLAKQALAQPSELDAGSILESNVTRVQLNGYPTARPEGKSAHIVSVTVFQSDIDASVRAGIENALKSALPGRELDIRSSLRAIQTVLHERADTHQYFVVAMGTDVTDCVSVRKEEITQHIIVEKGMSSVIHGTAGENGSPEEVASLLRMLITDTCSTEACDALKSNLAKIEPELVKSFADAFAPIAQKRRIPNACILVAHPDLTLWLEHFFTRLDFSQFTVTAQPFTVESLTPQHLTELVLFEPGTIPDTGIALGAAFVKTTASK